MNTDFRPFLRTLALAGAVVAFQATANSALAQDTSAQLPANIDALLAVPPELQSQLVQNLSGRDLAETLVGATPEQRLALVTALSPEARAALLASIAQSGAPPELVVDILVATIVADPEAVAAAIELVTQSAPADAGPALAAQVVAQVAGGCALLEQGALTGLVLAALSFDVGAADLIVQFGNSTDVGCAAKLAVALAEITATANDTIASAVEVALALEGGTMARLVAALRGEVEVAATPRLPEAPAQGPAVGPAGVGGPGSVPGRTPGSAAGEEAIFAQNAQGGGELLGGGGFVPVVAGQNVSP